MRKLLSISLGLFLLIGCSSSSSLLKTANSFNIPEVSETLIAEAKPEISTGKLETSGALEYYSTISESLKEFKADDSLEFEDEQIEFFNATERFYNSLNTQLSEYENKLEAAYAGQEFEDGVVGIYLFKIPVDWKVDTNDINIINSADPSLIIDYIFVRKNVLVFADPIYIDDVDTLFEVIAPLIDEQLDY